MDFDALVMRAFAGSVYLKEKITLKGDASSRQYHRLILDGAGAPRSVVVMELPEDAFGSDEASGGDRPAQLPFLEMARHLDAGGVRVPQVILDDSENGAVLLEDLGDNTLERLLNVTPKSDWERWYEAAVDLLVSMHRSMWPLPEDCLARTRSFSYDLLRWELDHYREWGAEALLGFSLSPSDKERMDREFDGLARRIADLPLGFVHRDYQSRNLMVIADECVPTSFVVIDFQDALVGPRVYDLVALLNDSYVSLNSDLKERLVARYARAMEIDTKQLLREFYLVTVQRKLKDGGRFVFIDRVKGNASFLPHVEDSFERVSDALNRLDELVDLKDLLVGLDSEHFASQCLKIRRC